MTAKRVIFTGQSGIKTKDALDFFIRSVSAFARKQRTAPLFLSVEDEMLTIYLKEKKRDRYPRIWVGEILNLPYTYLQHLWQTAFSSILQVIEKHKTQERDIFLNFHACFYHHDTVEYLSFVKETVIKEFHPDVFITLIDDIYDIHMRLRESNQIFHSAHGGADEPIGCILELMRILDWRSKEIMMARHFATELDVPHYIFAVKHTCDTLYKLIYENKPKFYISHPISEVRRLQKERKTERANEVIEEIRRFQDNISSEAICFLPTTIDELRINYKEKEDRKIFTPKLMSRWDENKYQKPINLLFIPPKERTGDTFCCNYSPVKNGEDATSLLNILYNHIEVQVSTRDHKLVEQTENLAVYRPCFNGNASGGVLKEIKYHLKSNKQNCFIYLPKKDQNDFKIRMLEEIMQDKIINNKIRYRNNRVKRNKLPLFLLTQIEKDAILNTEDDASHLMPIVDKIIDDHRLRVNADRKGLGSDTAQQSINVKTTLLNEFISSYITAIDEYKKAATKVWENDDLTPEGFVNNIMKYLSENITRG